MSRFMKFKRRKWSYILRSYIVWFLVFLFGLFILAKISGFSARLIEDWLIIKSKPAEIVNITKPVETDIIFNDEMGSEVFSERIISEIDQAKKSLEIAMYTFSSEKLKQAVYRAAARGLSVTIINDWHKHDSHELFFADAPTSIVRLELGSDSGGKTVLMHHKFALIDRGELGQKLIFGSYNWTELQEKYDPSFILISGNEALIASFGRDFDRMSSGFAGIKKLDNPNYHPWDLSLKSGDNNYEVWFSPGRYGDNIAARLDSLINNAQESLEIMIWDFTDKDLAIDLIRQARAGIKISLITDTWNFNNQNSVFQYLLEAKNRYNLDNFELIVDSGNGNLINNIKEEEGLDVKFDPFLHYHVLIADHTQVLFGTNNWSRAGTYYNDESIMISNDKKILERFQTAFERQYHNNISR